MLALSQHRRGLGACSPDARQWLPSGSIANHGFLGSNRPTSSRWWSSWTNPDVRLISNVVEVSMDDIRVGLQVDVFFEDWTDVSGDENTRV